MKIVVTGGGSGGHITPILAVAHELKQLQPDSIIEYIGQKGDGLLDVPTRDPNIDSVHAISAGKLRRYHGEGLTQLLDINTMLLNVRDVFRVMSGTIHSWFLLRRLKPEVVFVKGGYVGVPVGLAAAALRIPFITHDSDAIPGLANRIIARWATKHAVAMPKEVYSYPADRTVTVGVPVVAQYTYVTSEHKRTFMQELGLPADAQLLFIIGGGLGARRINDAVTRILPGLLDSNPKLYVVQGAGRANEAMLRQQYQVDLSPEAFRRVQVAGYLHDLYRYSGAADIIVTRAGATNLAEFAVQGKACIVVPAPFLAGGHQLKNAAYLAQKQATEQISESELAESPQKLAELISSLLQNPQRRQRLGANFRQFGHPHAARELAQLLLTEANTAHEKPS